VLSTPAAPRTTLALYVACLAVLAALMPLQQLHDADEVLVGFALLALVGLAVLTEGRLKRGGPPLSLAAIVIFVVAVAFLRDGTGASSGYGPLVLLPVIWSALRGHRVELIASISGAALVYAVPLLVVGSPAYPPTGWRSGTLIVLMATIIGVSVLRLVERLRASNEHAATIIGAMGEGFALLRNDRIVAVNSALCRITSLTEEQLVGSSPPYPFWPPENREEAAANRRNRVVASGGTEFELTLMRAGGERFPASVTVAPAQLGDGGAAFVYTVCDITERRAHEDAIRRRGDELDAIAAVTRAVSHSDPDEARRTICDVAIGVTGASSAALWEADSDGLLHATCTLGRPDIPETIGHDQTENGSRIVCRTGEPLFVADAAGSPHVDQRILASLVGDSASASFYFQPIGDTGGVRGVLVLSWSPLLAELPRATAPLLAVLSGEAAMAMQRADLLRQLAELSRTDELTGLPNRRAWEELLDREMRVARRTGQPLSVVMLDLDFFKSYNDGHGHQGGDRLLWLAAHLWRDNLRETDVLARWGGEEFGLLLPGCDTTSAIELVDRLHDLPLDGVTFSAGIAEWDYAASSDALLGRSDGALYGAKRAGRNRTHTAPVGTTA
jgi:diguanylate cyclase (GGDEF)-like protein/PAS domain S-box-containing protein